MFGKAEDKPITFGEFTILMPYMTDECREQDLKILNEAEKPDFLLGQDVLENFNLITFGQYSDLCDAIGMQNHIEAMKSIIMAIYDTTEDKILEESAYDVWGFCNFAIKECARINELFSSVHIEYTEQEKKAGIERLQFGTFGILDWYARRMGIVDQNLVNNEKWVRLYQCMKNDTDEAAYNRRLQKVYEAESKRKR